MDKPKKKSPAKRAVARGRKPAKSADLRNIVRGLVSKFAESSPEDMKISVGDFLRLLAVLKELEDEKGISEIRIQWVEPDKTGC